MPYMNLGYFSPRICMVMVIYSSEPFSKYGSATFALSPLTSGEFATFLATIKGGHIIYAFGVISCKESDGEVLKVCCAPCVIKVCSPKPGPCKSFVSSNSSFSASEIVVPPVFQSCSMSTPFLQFFFSKSAPT